jgi:ankyrin repeat protein
MLKVVFALWVLLISSFYPVMAMQPLLPIKNPQALPSIEELKSDDWIILNLNKETNLHEEQIDGLIKVLSEKNKKLPETRKIRVKSISGLDNSLRKQELIVKLGTTLNRNFQSLITMQELKQAFSKAAVKPKRIIVIDEDPALFEAIKQAFTDTQAVQIISSSYNLLKNPFSHKIFESASPKDSLKFPDTLDKLSFVQHLAGGAGGVSILMDTVGQKFTLKCGEQVAHLKEEITTDALYRSLEVRVPAFAVYNKLPNIDGVRCPAQGLYRLAQFIPSGKQDNTKLTYEMKQNFVADAYLSNWDIVVGPFKNVILDTYNKLWRVDNGGALRYTSLGKPKKDIPSWDPNTVAELETMRDPKGNPDGAKVYAGIPHEELNRQASDLVSHQEAMMKTLDNLDAAIHLDNLPELREILRNRMDYLVKTFNIHVPGVRAGVASTAHPVTEKTAAGILVYSFDPPTGEPVVLLGKRIRHNWWSNFGGSSDKPDQELAVTAAREVGEESFDLVYFIPSELNKMPSHDILNSMGIKYRMYVAPYKYISIEEFRKRAANHKYQAHVEYTDFQWVPVKDLLNSLDGKHEKLEEEKTTVEIPYQQEGLVLYNVFWEMLKEPQVIKLLENLRDKKPLGSPHTTQKGLEASRYLPVEEERRQLAETTVGHGKVIAELKGKSTPSNEVASLTERALAAIPYTQSQAHLAMEIGKSFVDQHLNDPLALVREFLTKKSFARDTIKDEQYINTMTSALKEEINQRGMVAFYHATDPLSSFLFDVYSAFRTQLKASSPDKLTVLRGYDTHFRTLNDVEAFIHTYSQNESINNANVIEGVPYAEMGLSANFFEFGSEGVAPSATYLFFYNTQSMAPPPFDSIFNAFVKETGIQADIEDFKRLYKHFYQRPNNIYNAKLYQIFIAPTVVDQVAYLSLTAGALLNIKLTDGSSYHGFRKIIGDLRSDLPKFTQTIKRDANDLQARLFLKPELFHDPKVINIQTYWRYPIDEKAYKNKLDALVSQTLVKTLQEHSKSSEHAFAEGKPALKRIHEEASKAVTGLPYMAKEKSIKSLPQAIEDEDYKAIENNLAKMTSEKLNSQDFHNPMDKYDRKEYTLLNLLSDKAIQNVRILALLKDKGLDLNARTFYREGLTYTLMERAAINGFLNTLGFLVASGVDINAVGPNGSGQKTPLTLAVENGHLTIVQFLAEKGANITKGNPLYQAAGNNRIDVVAFLISKGANVNELANTHFLGYPKRWPPLYIACKNGYLDVVRLLVKSGADLSFKDEQSGSLLHIAAQEGHRDIVQFLVEKGQDVNAKNKSGITPLHLAALWGKTDVVRYLVEQKAEVNALNNEGETPLQKAEQGFPSYFRTALLNQNGSYYKPRFEAYDKAKPEIIKILKEAGAK